jgi:hypothetical protein
MTRRAARAWAAAIGVALLLADGALVLADDAVPVARAPEITVTAPRGLTSGGIAPLLELSPSDLQSYGVDSLSDLVDALKPLTRSSRSDGAPVVLINGHLAGLVEFANLPSDAVERVEVLPETVALQYGFSENQRVLNIVLREHYRAVPTKVSEGGATQGGDRTTQVDASLVRLNSEARVTALGSFQSSAKLLESDRGISQPDNLYRTLQPDKSEGKAAATVTGTLFGVSSSLEGSFDRTTTQSLQGAVEVTGAPTLLKQTAEANTVRFGAQLTGQLGRFVWGASASYSHLTTNSSGAIGLDDVGSLGFDRTNSALTTGGLQLSLSGRIATLPAGSVVANIKAGFGYQDFLSEGAYLGAPLARSNLKRTDGSASFNASLPITSHDGGVGAAAGDLSATVNLSFDDVSDFGALLSPSVGLDWSPTKKVYLNAIFTDHQTPPTVQQVLAPETVTPNVEMFDFINGRTVYVTLITGGAPNLRATEDRVASFGVSLGPFLGKTTFSAHYEQHRIRDAVGTLPPLTAAVEMAFPERFVHDADGTLIEIDNRSVSLQRQDMSDLKWGFNAWFPFGSQPKGGTSNRFEFSAFDTWVQKDEILIRDGIPPLNLLNGAPSTGAGGQPRHQIDLSALIYKDGLGAVLSSTWHSATSVDSSYLSELDALRFSALGTVNLRLFADLSRLPATHDQQWAHGMRVAFQVLNLFDRRQSVQDSAGLTPTAFAPGYLDPVGRTVWFTVRKAFQ